MGQAKLRGSKEQRIAQAIKRAEEEYNKQREAERAYWESLSREEIISKRKKDREIRLKMSEIMMPLIMLRSKIRI